MFRATVEGFGHIYLDPLGLSHAKKAMNWVNNMHANQYLTRVFPITLESEQEWLQFTENSTNEFVWGIFVDSEDASQDEEKILIGSCGIHKIDWVSRTAETGISIGLEAYWSKGIGTKVKKIVMQYAFKNLNLNRISVNVIAFNERSLALQKKAGFTEEGRLRKMFYKNGKYYDEVLFGMLHEEYKELVK